VGGMTLRLLSLGHRGPRLWCGKRRPCLRQADVTRPQINCGCLRVVTAVLLYLASSTVIRDYAREPPSRVATPGWLPAYGSLRTMSVASVVRNSAGLLERVVPVADVTWCAIRACATWRDAHRDSPRSVDASAAIVVPGALPASGAICVAYACARRSGRVGAQM
jgi:hypothetical protein